MEKRTPALWRFSSDTTRQASSASLRVLNGPCTWAEPSTSLWKFIEPNSPPITQKLLPLVMIASCLFRPLLSRLNLDFRTMRLELRGFGRIVKRRGRRGAAGDGGRHQIEVAGADFALMARRRIAVLLGRELGLLQAGVSRHALSLVAARQFEHAVVERVEARQCHELELITHGTNFALEFCDGGLVDIGFPIERGRAVIGQHLAGIDLVHGVGKFLRLFEVRGRGFPPQEISILRERDAALDAVSETGAGLEAVKTFRGAFAGDELAIALVDIGGDQFCTFRIGARQDKSRRATDVGGQ